MVTTAICGCRKSVPVRVAEWVVEAAIGAPDETVVATYRCRRCGVVSITVAHLTARHQAA
jgi:ribosomal protein L37E